MKTIQHLTKFLLSVAAVLSFTIGASAQVNLSSDHSKWIEHPLVKKYGINISNKSSYNALVTNAQALNDLDVRYIRLMTGWGQEVTGTMFDQPQVTVSGSTVTYDYTRIDQITSLLKGNGRQFMFVAGNCPKSLGTNFNDFPDTTAGKWTKLIKGFTQHWATKNIGGVSIELWNKPDDKANFAADTTDYLKLYALTNKAVKDADFKVKVGGPSTDGMWYNKLRQYTWDNNLSKDFVSGHAQGFDNLVAQMNEGGRIREIKNGEWYWEAYMSSYTSFAPNSADAVSYKAASAFFNEAKYLTKYHEVTRVYMNQLLDTNDGAKGLIAADGKKQPLFFALKLYNEMPFDRRPITGETSDVQGLSSSDDNKAMIVAWNNSSSAKEVNLALSNLSFTSGSVELIRIDDTHSINGELSVEATGNLADNIYSKTVTIPANGIACIRIVKDASKDNMKFNSFGKYVNDKRMWWFAFSEGWCWNGFDPKTMTAYLGDTITRDWGINQIGVYIDSIPQKINMKWDILGNTIKKDDNTALYMRIDFEDMFEGEKYWAHSVVYCDTVHLTGSFSENHGSMPSFGSGQRENEIKNVDFTNPNGVDIDIKSLFSDEWTGEDWTGNAVLTFYIQNPGSGATGIIAKAKLTDITLPTSITKNTGSEGNSMTIYPNPFKNELNIKTSSNASNTVTVFDLTGKEVMRKVLPAGNTVNTISTVDLTNGMYIVKVENANSTSINKAIKK